MHARNDAEAIADALSQRFSFPKMNVRLLLDDQATRETILREFLKYTTPGATTPDDRVLVFFAGHGHTVGGRRGEIGFLVPADGRSNDLSTLIRWDELTRNADLIPAKHVLFLMDACYGGLALTRTTIPPGSMRFLKDMLQRYSRQVLTAGKADEAVSDTGGTRVGHSIFTSHLLDGLEGAAAPGGNIITGHGLMAYVYEKVSSDTQSHQTPHFGFIDGDGDFIFDTSILSKIATPPSPDGETETDVFIKSPPFEAPQDSTEETTSDAIKRLISSPSEKIRLNDYIVKLLRSAISRLGQDKFPASGPVTNEEFASRLKAYEDAISDLTTAVVLLAHWASSDQVGLLERIFTRLADVDKGGGGTVLWLRLGWYPILLLMYAAGISALAANRFDTLRVALLAPAFPGESRASEGALPIVRPTIEALTDIVGAFKMLPDMERKYVPRSEHIYKKLQPVLEDELFLGRTYDSLFDQFEIMLALTFSDLRDEDPTKHVWGPPGRFAWKERGMSGDPVYSRFVGRTKALGETWKALPEGFFKGSSHRFAEVAEAYGSLLANVHWW